MAAADYRLMTEATGQRIAAALEALSGTGAAAAAARTNLDVYSKGETDNAIAQSTAKTSGSVTPNTTYIYENSLNWSKCGNVVCIHGFFLSAPAGVPAGSQLYTLPFTPVSNGGCSIATYNGDEIRALAWDANNKTIKLQTSDISTAKWFYCAFAYIASD